MKNIHHLLLIITFFLSISVFSQEKLKGNKDVTIEDRPLSNFSKIEVIDDIDVHLTYGTYQAVQVETDSNLQEVIITDVKSGILTIKTAANIGRKKSLIDHIKLNNDFKEISAFNHANIISKSLLVIDSLKINAFDNADFDLNIHAKELQLNCKKTSDLKLDVLCENLAIISEESSTLKANLQTQTLNVQLLDRSAITVTGNAKELDIQSYGNSTFKGSDFVVETTLAKATNNSKMHLNTTKKISIYAINSSEMYIYSNPKIDLIEFFDKATLYKRVADKKLF
jgi:hypothetical protein